MGAVGLFAAHQTLRLSRAGTEAQGEGLSLRFSSLRTPRGWRDKQMSSTFCGSSSMQTSRFCRVLVQFIGHSRVCKISEKSCLHSYPFESFGRGFGWHRPANRSARPLAQAFHLYLLYRHLPEAVPTDHGGPFSRPAALANFPRSSKDGMAESEAQPLARCVRARHTSLPAMENPRLPWLLGQHDTCPIWWPLHTNG